MKTIKFNEIVKEVASELGLTQTLTKEVLKTYHEKIGEELSNGNEVKLGILGKLFTKIHKGRKGQYVPSTKTKMDTKDKKIVGYKSSTRIKNMVS